MREVVILANGQVDFMELDVPELAENEVLIRLRMAGICSTDLALRRGYYDFEGIPGHEFVGEVIAGDENWIGKRVVGEINIIEENDDLVQMGLKTHARNRRVLGIKGGYDGAFATVFRLPVQNLYEVPDTVTDEQAVFTEPLAAACQILEQVHIPPDETVYVLGTGKLGMLVAGVMHVSGIRVIGIVRHQHHAELLRKWGIEAQHRSDIPDQHAAFVVDTTGSPEGFTDAIQLLRPRGTLILKSTHERLTQADLSAVVVNELTIVGSRCGPFPVALRHLEAGRIDVQSLITETYALRAIEIALTHAEQSGVLKILLQP